MLFQLTADTLTHYAERWNIELGNNDDLGLIASRIADLPQAKTLTGAEAITPSISFCHEKGLQRLRALDLVDMWICSRFGSAAEPNFFFIFTLFRLHKINCVMGSTMWHSRLNFFLKFFFSAPSVNDIFRLAQFLSFNHSYLHI